jgi:hypothetical protein
MAERQQGNQAWDRSLPFLDWDLGQLMSQQSEGLNTQLRHFENSQVPAAAFAPRAIRSIEEFRSTVLLTDDSHYAPLFVDRNVGALSEPPASWLRTSGPTESSPKWVPLSAAAREQLSWATLGILIAAQATRMRDVRLRDEPRILNLTAPPPFFTGSAVAAFAELRPWPATLYPIDDAGLEDSSFERRMARALSEASRTGVDLVLSYSSVLSGIGRSLSKPTLPFAPSRDPRGRFRLARARTLAALARRTVLPKDVWSPKAIVAGGVDAALFRENIIEEWGRDPLELLASTDGLFMGMQTWDRTTTTLIPTFNFFEFIPGPESDKQARNPSYTPSTVLFDELSIGQSYELVITNLLGGALARYRTGEVLRMTSFENHVSGVRLPQFVYEGQRTEVLEIAGFVRLNEGKIQLAIEKSRVPINDWVIEKDLEGSMPIVSLRIEMADRQAAVQSGELADRVVSALREIDQDWRDMEDLADIHPLRLRVLAPGAFEELDRSGLRDRGFRRVNPSSSITSLLDNHPGA